MRNDEGPLMSHNLMKERVFPNLDKTKPSIFLLLDNLRYDQWKTIEPIITEMFRIEEEETFYSILPTTTQYSRNAIFAGMMPGDIAKHYPKWWKNDSDEGGKNMHERDCLGEQIKRLIRKDIKFDYINREAQCLFSSQDQIQV